MSTTITTTTTTSQSLKSCLESLLLEPRDLTHQLLPSKPILSIPSPHLHNQMKEEEEEEEEDYSFCKASKSKEEVVYVHPLSKRCNFLSSKSLEMCTESLGCETGSGIADLSDKLTAVHTSSEKPPQLKKRQQPIKNSFPPPLTSVSGGLHVESHREGGRLLIKTFNFSSTSNFFQAERADGRLKLSLLQEQVGEEVLLEGNSNVVKDEAGKVRSSNNTSTSRCNGESSRRKGLQSFRFCVVGV